MPLDYVYWMICNNAVELCVADNVKYVAELCVVDSVQ